MEDNKLWYLKKVDLFEGISDEELLKIATRCVGRKVNKKDMVYTPFEGNKTVYFLKQGEVTLYYSHYGKKLILDVLKAGSLFGNISFGDGSSDHFAEVTEDAYLCLLDFEDFFKMIQSKPELMMKLIQIMSSRIHEYENTLKTGLFDAKEKILYHLERIENKQKGIVGKFLPKRITHEKLAQYTGLSRETVSRALQDLKKSGIVETRKDGSIGLVAQQ